MNLTKHHTKYDAFKKYTTEYNGEAYNIVQGPHSRGWTIERVSDGRLFSTRTLDSAKYDIETGIDEYQPDV